MDKALSSIVEAMQTWEQANDPETLKKRVHDLLDKNAEELLKKLLGFDHRYRGWELDNCNGRGGESAAGDYIKKVQQQAIQDWLSQVKLPKLTPTFLKKIEKQAQAQYENQISDDLYGRVREKADADLKQLISQAVSSNTFEKHQKTLALLNPGNTKQD